MDQSSFNQISIENKQLLSRAIEGDSFQFIVVQWGHYSQIQSVCSLLSDLKKTDKVTVIDFGFQTLPSLDEEIEGVTNQLILVSRFELLLENEEERISFNQKRGYYARRDISLVVFIPPGERYVKELAEKLPDWWSVLALLVELPLPMVDYEMIQLVEFREGNISSIGGDNWRSKQAELARLLVLKKDLRYRLDDLDDLQEIVLRIFIILSDLGKISQGNLLADEWIHGLKELGLSLMEESQNFSLILLWIIYFRMKNNQRVQAVEYSGQRLEWARNKYGKGHIVYSEYLVSHANMLREIGDYQAAGKCYSQLYLGLESYFNSGYKTVELEYEIGLADTLLMMGMIDEGLRKLEEIEQKVRSIESNNFLRSFLHLIKSKAFLMMGKSILAREELLTVKKNDEINLSTPHPRLGITNLNLGLIWKSLGDHYTATNYFEEAQKSFQYSFPPDHHLNIQVRELLKKQ